LQTDAMDSDFRRRGVEWVEFVETASGGADAHRPVRDRLLAEVARRRFSSVMVWRYDRFARSTVDLILGIDSIQRAGCSFISLTEGVDTTTAAGRMVMQIFGSVAEFERQLIRERTRAGILAAQARGVHCGRRAAWIDWELYALLRGEGRTVGEAAEILRVHRRTLQRRAAARGESTPPPAAGNRAENRAD
ncbi:MAG: recombinase family protein, partial [Terriglobales bacterium]